MKSGKITAILTSLALCAGSLLSVSANAVILGDVDNSGKIDSLDASAILALYTAFSTGRAEITDDIAYVCDVNMDGIINASDASAVLAYYSYLSTGGNLSIEDFLVEKGTIESQQTTAAPTTEATISYEEQMSIYEQRIGQLVNQARAENGLPELQAAPVIMNVGKMRAIELTEQYGHTRPDGTDVFYYFKNNGMSYYGAAENVAKGQKTPEACFESWKKSTKGHWENILNPSYRYMGIGVEESKGKLYWAIVFINPRTDFEGGYYP